MARASSSCTTTAQAPLQKQAARRLQSPPETAIEAGRLGIGVLFQLWDESSEIEAGAQLTNLERKPVYSFLPGRKCCLKPSPARGEASREPLVKFPRTWPSHMMREALATAANLSGPFSEPSLQVHQIASLSYRLGPSPSWSSPFVSSCHWDWRRSPNHPAPGLVLVVATSPKTLALSTRFGVSCVLSSQP